MFTLFFIFAISSFSQQENDPYMTFMERENINQHFQDMKQSSLKFSEAAYIPESGKVIEITEVLIPTQDLEIVRAQNIPESLQKAALVTYNGQEHFRFLIHPASLELYSHLITKYGINRKLSALPTSSTRTVLVPTQPGIKTPFFAKLSMDQEQFGFGRIVPDWEVRRSVHVTSQMQDYSTELEAHGITLITEGLGAYIKIKDGALPSSKVANNQPLVLQHGLIYRDATFLEKYSHLDIYPLFSLFDAPEGEKPLVMHLWEKELLKRSISFEDFCIEFLIEPFVRTTSYLAMHHGLFPEAHGQNVIVGINPKTNRVVHFFHRDMGSVKVHLLLRLARGLGISKLLTHSTLWDFKPDWIHHVLAKPFTYFFDHMFSMSRPTGIRLKKARPLYDPKKIQTKFLELIEAEIQKYLGTTSTFDYSSLPRGLADSFHKFVSTHPPQVKSTPPRKSKSSSEILVTPWELPLGLSTDLKNYSLESRSYQTANLVIDIPGGPRHHYTTHIHAQNVFLGAPISDLDTKDAKLDPTLELLHGKPPLVVKVGSSKVPYFIPLEHDFLFGIVLDLSKNARMPVEVTADLSDLSPQRQVEIIEKTLGEKQPLFSCWSYFQ